ncbi:site-specific integrase [Cellulomonas alba]|uniref:Site-specific integrase n=1 Tax=Cellulomonas alba TaxID=3053467 RepID=A0ABT7SBT1_9CELL|nr:site-specific integrase [Cellulomonas alba]MDM7853647.1 site-specific integrase [Cellulomonas alba]
MSRAHGHLVGTGRVTLYVPTGSRPYYRLSFVDATGERRHRSLGRDPEFALHQAEALDAELANPDTGSTVVTLGELVREYVSTPRDRKRDKGGHLTGEDWTESNHAKIADDLARAVKGIEGLPATDLDLATINRMRSACGTPGMVRQMTSEVRNFLCWAAECEAISWEQAALLPQRARTVAPRLPQEQRRPRRREQVLVQGQAASYVSEEDAPHRSACVALAETMQLRVPWGELAVHTAIGAGLRQGEQFQLTADDIVRRGNGWVIRVFWQWSTNAATGRRRLPKNRKRRWVPVLRLTRDEYPLLEKLLERAEEAQAEQRAGTNPDALLFPAPQGGMWWTSNLNELITESQKAAGWKYTVTPETRTMRNGERRAVLVTQMEQPWHTLRHRFARDMVDWMELKKGQLMQIGGWDNEETVNSRYYRTGEEHLDSALDRFYND